MLPVAVLVVGIVIFQLVNTFAKAEPESLEEDLRPLIEAKTILPEDYQVNISGFGSIEPFESTQLSSQVSGEVESWHPQFIEGGLVKRGEALFTLDRTAYEAAYLQAEANLASAEANLIEQKALAKVAEDEARNNPQKTYTDLFLRKPQVISAESAVKSAQASLKIAKRDLENCEVYAPYNALVVKRDIGLGQYITTGSPIATLYNIETAKLVIPIPDFEAEFLPEQMSGTPVSIHVTGSPSKTRSGEVRHAIGVVDEATRMTQIFIDIPDPLGLSGNAPALKFGTYVEARFQGKIFSNIYKLPQDLVNSESVWLLENNSNLTEAKVNVLRQEGKYFLINDGLQISDQVVTKLPEYPSEGMSVRTLPQSTAAERNKLKPKIGVTSEQAQVSGEDS